MDYYTEWLEWLCRNPEQVEILDWQEYLERTDRITEEENEAIAAGEWE